MKPPDVKPGHIFIGVNYANGAKMRFDNTGCGNTELYEVNQIGFMQYCVKFRLINGWTDSVTVGVDDEIIVV